MREGGDVWVSVKHICQTLEINPWTQQRKLKSYHCPVTSIMPVTEPDGVYNVFCVLLKNLPIWLVTIEVGRGKEASRPPAKPHQPSPGLALFPSPTVRPP
jgi:hypothetical protein